ncbi:MAG: tRNA (adenosine(37)-N6)-threonylcarbamoyltransferase complex transferase subunit TsaD [bacterium]|nr:tRNA (adenosine(37)-N6)-threonylcarbamoyltransferase complex transferase subunit TsaD [bacterium]
MKKTIILAIETSCDETGLALVEASGGLKSPRFKILKNLIASQIKVHQPFGGVVPNLAKREHLKNLPILYKKLVAKPYTLDPDLIAVTVGPGLEPALWTGINFAEKLGKEIKNQKSPPKADPPQAEKIKIIGTNHLEGHLYSFLLPSQSKTYNLKPKTLFPAAALIVSGGHTILLLVKDLKSWKHLGETRDDAVGEAFDKVARLLKLPYPGGPALEKLARKGDSRAIEFPRPMMHDKNFDFSFSGLKTSVLYYLRDLGYSQWPLATRVNSRKLLNPIPQTLMANIAASFQAAAIEVLVKKTMRAAREFGARSVMLSGGVAANKSLRAELKKETRKTGLNFLVAEQKYNTDNAVMIAVAGYMTYLRKKKYPMKANGNLSI